MIRIKTLTLCLLLTASSLVALAQNTQSIYAWPTTGTDTYAASITGAGTTYTNKWWKLKFVNANTGASTLAVNGGAAVGIKKKSSGAWVDLASGDINAGDVCFVSYDGTRWQIELTQGGGSGGITDINGQSDSNQIITTDGTGTDVGVSSSGGTHTIHLPTASGTNRGVLSNGDWTTFNSKQSAITFGAGVQTAIGVNIGSAGAPVLFNGALGTPSTGTLTNATGLPPTTGISGWPANSSGVLTNNGSGTLSWGAGGGGITTTALGGTGANNSNIQNSLALLSPLPLLYNGSLSTGDISMRAIENTDLPAKNRFKLPMYGTPFAYGDSFTLGSNASPSTWSYVNQLNGIYGITITNNAVSGKGVIPMAIASYAAQPVYEFDHPTIVFVGFNDLRRGGSASATLNKINAGHTAMIVNSLLKFAVPASTCSETGSWSNFTALTGKASNLSGNSRQSSTSGNTIGYTTTTPSDNIVIGTYGTDGVTYDYGRLSISIDGGTAVVYNPNGNADLVTDGTLDNGRGPDVIVITGLRNSTHTVGITVLDNKTTVLDFVGYMREPTACPPVYVVSPPRMDATGYATAPANATDAVITAGKLSLKAMLNSTFVNYPVAFVDLDQYYDISTGLDAADHIHPNNVGHGQITKAIQSAVINRSSYANYVNTTLEFRNSTTNTKGFAGLGADVWRFGVNRNPLTGVFYSTGRAAAMYEMIQASADGSHKWWTSAANNTTPTNTMTHTKDGDLTVTRDVRASGGMQVQGNISYTTGSGLELLGSTTSATVRAFNRNTPAWIPFTVGGLTLTFQNSATTNGNITSGLWRIGDATTASGAFLHMAPGTTTVSPFKLTSGTNLTSATAGSMEYDGSNLYFSPSTTRKRTALTNNATPSNGQIPIGNGTDYTVANITGSNGVSVTNGSGTIALAATTSIPASATNDNATAGNLGENSTNLVAVGSAVSLTTATPANIITKNLAAGDWIVCGGVTFTEGSATVTARSMSITTISATISTDGSEAKNDFPTTTTTLEITVDCPCRRVSLSASTNVYLVASSTFSAGTSAAYGTMNFWRPR